MILTINEAMVWSKALKGRLAELSRLRSDCAVKETWHEPNKVIEPLYDLKDLDRRCVEIQNALLEIDATIKQMNAVTKISIAADVKSLLTPLQ